MRVSWPQRLSTRNKEKVTEKLEEGAGNMARVKLHLKISVLAAHVIVLAALLLVHLPADVPGKATEHDLRT